LNNFTGLARGLTTCEGCAMEAAARHMIEILGPRTIILTPPSCSAILTGFGRETGWQVPSFMSNLEAVAAYASGVREALDILGKGDINVVGYAGDGGTLDIGLQALSGAIERGHRLIYVCYDNEAYMNTGIQRSSATPAGAWTTTTPGGKQGQRKDIDSMLAAQGIPYLATASAAYIDDFRAKVAKAMKVDGPSFIHLHTACPTGWRFDPAETYRLGKLAVDSGLWVLYEVENGKYRVTKKIKALKPANQYFMAQGRFKHLSEQEIEGFAAQAREGYDAILAKENC
jgi:pyruvate ferredoxin oxidoreductase beta subunit